MSQNPPFFCKKKGELSSAGCFQILTILIGVGLIIRRTAALIIRWWAAFLQRSTEATLLGRGEIQNRIIKAFRPFIFTNTWHFGLSSGNAENPRIVGKLPYTHPVILRFAGYFRVTMSFTKIGGASMYD